jgi:hypothetical protein
MFKAKIFLVGTDEEDLTPMEETAYKTEDVLQKALEKYPNLLAGDQIDPDNPRSWLLVAREMPVRGAENEPGRWSVDHLFLDQDGRPTFVECKRASDTRARREVVAQMLDYAANGTAYWSADRLRQSAAETANTRGKSLDDQIRQLVQGEQVGIEAFWQKVEENLKQGNVRLIFVADDISQELRRLVDFLDRKMTDANVRVLAIEIKQFKGKHQRAMVPRVIGRTEDPETIHPVKLTRTEFLKQCPPETRGIFEMVLDRAVERGHSISWGKAFFSVRAILPKGQRTISFAYGGLRGVFQVYLRELPVSPAENQALRKQLMEFGIFQKAGEKTLNAKLDAKAIAKLPEVYEFLLGKMDEIVKEY